MMNEDFVLKLCIFYLDLEEGKYVATNEQFKEDLKGLYVLIGNWKNFGNNAIKYVLNDNPKAFTENVFHKRVNDFWKFTEYASLLYFGDTYTFFREILKYLGRD